MRVHRVGAFFVFGGVLMFGCAQRANVPPRVAAPTLSPEAAITQPVARPIHKPRTPIPQAKPEVGIVAPMKGEPAPAALAQTRLQATTCDQASADSLEPLLRQMREAVNESQREWVSEQPDCWQAMRDEAEEARLEPSLRMADAPVAKVAKKPLAKSPPAPSGDDSTKAIEALSRSALSSADDSEPAAAKKRSGTNNQVATVDEADIVKTDGKYVYLVTSGALRIMEALKPRVISSTRLPGTAREMFVEGDRAIVYTSDGNPGKSCAYAYECDFAGDGTHTKIQVFNIADRAHPALLRTLDLSGSLITARRIGHAIHTVVSDGDLERPNYETWPEDLDMCGVPDAVAKAKFAALKRKNELVIRAEFKNSGLPTIRENGVESKMCKSVLRTAIKDGRAFTSLVSFDLMDDQAAPVTQTIQSRPGAVFASEKSLYVAVAHQKEDAATRWYSFYSNTNEVSDIHKFRIGASPKDTRYIGSGTVPGHVLNQFAMDEWYGYLRVATSKGHVPDPGVESAISILSEAPSGNLVRVGAVDHIAPSEDIRAVRFDDERGYIVTFKKTDPLFVIDMLEPKRPKILGELKIPGFSTYLHRIDPEHLLSIGFDADDQGDFAYFNGIILQLFDVKDATNPKLVHKEKIGTRGSSSEAATNHLAFNFMQSEGLLALPMTICEGGGNGAFGQELTFSGLLVYDVDLDHGFTRLGGIQHGKRGVSCETWWSNASSEVKRSVFLDDLVYSIAEDRVKVQNLNHLGSDVADMSFSD